MKQSSTNNNPQSSGEIDTADKVNESTASQNAHCLTLDSNHLVELLDCAVIVADESALVRQVNVAAETLFNRSRRHLIGRSLLELMPINKLANYFTDCLDNNAHVTLRETQFEVGGAETMADVTLQCVTTDNSSTSGQNRAVLVELNSTTRISRFIQEKNRMERHQSFRLMMRGLAHEIKNPLGGIRGAAQLLSREINQPESLQLTDILIREADRLTRLVDRVMGSRQQLKPRLLNIHEILEHVITLTNAKHDQASQPLQIKINRFYDPALPEIAVDKEQVIQAMLNIVGNAVEAQLDKAQAVIGIETEFDRFFTIDQTTYRRVLKIRVWDEGDGVDDGIRDILFDPLITTRSEGTGLGLSITQEIIQRHKGVVVLEDHDSRTCFTVYLPYLDDNVEGVCTNTENGGGDE